MPFDDCASIKQDFERSMGAKNQFNHPTLRRVRYTNMLTISRYYLNKILDQAGIQETYKQTQINIILSCWSFAVAILGSFMLDIIGRRLQTLIGMSGIIVTLYTIGGLIKSKSNLFYKAQSTDPKQNTVKAQIHLACTVLLLWSSCSRAFSHSQSHR